MNHRERLKLLVRSQLFYFGALMFVVGVAICSNVDQNNFDAQLPAAILAQGGIIVCFWAYRRTRFVSTDPAGQALQKRRSRMGLIIGVGVVCVGFMLTPVILWSDMAKMHGFLFWYIAATGFIGLLGLVGLFIWLKRSSER
jgi:hypothetical protein